MSSPSISQILGTTPVSEDNLPCISASLTDSALCRAVARNLPPNTLFRVDDNYFTINIESKKDNTGTTSRSLQQRIMTPARLCSWIEQHITFREDSNPIAPKVSLNKLQAEKILASDDLRAATPTIREICDVRLPMWGPDKDGKRTLRLAPVGYDAETQVYTADLIPWDADKKFSTASVVRVLHHTLKDFPWSEEQPFHHTRSVSAFLAYMIGQFCRHLINRHPIVVINGNQPGTGKTLLAAMGLSAVYGNPDVSPYPQDDDALAKMLFSQLLAKRTYVLIDDLANLASPTVNLYATSSHVTERRLGGNVIARAENRIQLITTGNNIKTSPDVERRSLIVDLFAQDRATERTISTPLTPYTFARADWRAPLLQLLWSLTHAWEQAGCPEHVPGGKMPSFESFASVAGSIVVHAGFTSPFGPRDAGTDSGDTIGKTIERLLATIAGSIEPDDPTGTHIGLTVEKTVAEILEQAEHMGVADIICGGKEKARSLGHKLRNLKGRAFVDTQGRRFEFGRRKDAAGSKYPIIITSEPPDIQATD